MVAGLLRPCVRCGEDTIGFDEEGPLCINCAVVKAAAEESDDEDPATLP